jgi:hypothetical protein
MEHFINSERNYFIGNGNENNFKLREKNLGNLWIAPRILRFPCTEAGSCLE